MTNREAIAIAIKRLQAVGASPEECGAVSGLFERMVELAQGSCGLEAHLVTMNFLDAETKP